MSELCFQVGAVEQKIGAVKGHAEADVQHASRDHSDPGSEISMVGMNMLDSVALKLYCVIGAKDGV